MNWRQVIMPPAIAARPRTAEGYPIPFVNLVDKSTGPDLRVLDGARVLICLQQKRCAICGGLLQREKVFIGGPACVENRLFADPAMHEACARYASLVCPYLATQNYHHASLSQVSKANPSQPLHANPLAPKEGEKRPDRMALYFCTGFTPVLIQQNQQQTPHAHAYPARRIEWF